MTARQRGAGMLIAVLLVLTVAAFAIVIAASQSGGDIQATDANADSLQALFLAETGVERALKRFATGTACGAGLAETITDLSTLGMGATGYSITVGNGVLTDFAGATLPVQTQCRIVVTARVIANNVSRTIHAIVDRNLLEGPDNPTFNNPLTGTTPSGWTALNPPAGAAFAPNGSPDGTAPNCRRSAWVAKDNPGGQPRRASATAPVQFTVASGSTTTITFYRRVFNRNDNCGSLPVDGAALPGACGAALDSTVCFQLVGINTAAAAQTWTVASNAAAVAGPNLVACPTPFNPCSTSYPGYPAKVAPITVTMTNAVSVSQFIYHLQVQSGGRKELFVDNIEATNPTAVGAAYVRAWRDCSTVANPVTCG